MPAILLFSIWDTRTPSGETFSFISVPICAFSSSSVMPGEGTNGMLPYEHTTHWKTTIKSWQGKKEERKKRHGPKVWLWKLIKECCQIQRRHKHYNGVCIVCCYQCATLQHILRLYSETPILQHVDLTKKLWNQRKCKTRDNTEKQKIGISQCLVLFIIKIKFTQYNNVFFLQTSKQ